MGQGPKGQNLLPGTQPGCRTACGAGQDLQAEMSSWSTAPPRTASTLHQKTASVGKHGAHGRLEGLQRGQATSRQMEGPGTLMSPSP